MSVTNVIMRQNRTDEWTNARWNGFVNLVMYDRNSNRSGNNNGFNVNTAPEEQLKMLKHWSVSKLK